MVFLDFDGVICDSVKECFVSSWLAYHQHVRRAVPQQISIKSLHFFCELRPFIRAGGDLVVIQHLLYRGAAVKGQEDFDRYLAELGPATLEQYKNSLYGVRKELLSTVPQYFYSLNPFYPEALTVLRAHAKNHDLFILSTKKPALIGLILAFHRIDFDPSRIIFASTGDKLGIIKNLLPSSQKALFIDDQIDYLRDNPYHEITGMLASWGYIKKEWLVSPFVQVINRQTLTATVKEFLSAN